MIMVFRKVVDYKRVIFVLLIKLLNKLIIKITTNDSKRTTKIGNI